MFKIRSLTENFKDHTSRNSRTRWFYKNNFCKDMSLEVIQVLE